jgi:hypothetical protein
MYQKLVGTRGSEGATIREGGDSGIYLHIFGFTNVTEF